MRFSFLFWHICSHFHLRHKALWFSFKFSSVECRALRRTSDLSCRPHMDSEAACRRQFPSPDVLMGYRGLHTPSHSFCVHQFKWPDSVRAYSSGSMNEYSFWMYKRELLVDEVDEDEDKVSLLKDFSIFERRLCVISSLATTLEYPRLN
ncbi:hypothetical protein BpHYR1_008936 [Brachionus plicatilis]|uniref:Uncharacterized protein n=1 Tax=Brachionus plicatilis TaxID=10195 RepID=A0A3M7RKQ3_BRAPC|nr:hypothetical protein BpHYR1_008936 [Brachionus plicatilis]